MILLYLIWEIVMRHVLYKNSNRNEGLYNMLITVNIPVFGPGCFVTKFPDSIVKQFPYSAVFTNVKFLKSQS